MRTSITLVVLCACALTSAAELGSFEVVHEWVRMDFQWDSESDRKAALDSEAYVPDNCVLSDVKALDGHLYVTVPRWRHGVPSSVNRVVKEDGKSLLQPYPSWEMNKAGGDCSSIQYAHAIEIDPLRRMWILDTGRRGLFTRPVTECPAKLIVWDMTKNKEVRRHVFPEEVVDKTRALLKDIVVDTTDEDPDNWFAFIASTGETRLVVYSFKEDSSWFVEHGTMDYDPTAIVVRTVDGTDATLTMGIESLALSPHLTDSEDHLLYFAPLASYHFFGVRTASLKNRTEVEAAEEADWDVAIRRLGGRSSQSEGMTVSESGVMFYSVLETNAINQWNLSQPFSALDQVYKDDTLLQWPDSFGWDSGYLYFTSNRLQLFINHLLPEEEVNFRLMRAKVGQAGYMGPYRAAADRVAGSLLTAALLLVLYVRTSVIGP